MATYAIGDVQGCFDTLIALLRRIDFNPEDDRLWLAGDLVNRGPRSLDVLRYARGLGDAAVIVLGNHDMHFLARHVGVADVKARDTLDELLLAPDADELAEWLAGRPLFYREGDRVLVHAGLLPQWTLEDAQREADRISARLRDPRTRRSLLARRRDDKVLKVLTTIRTCQNNGDLCKYDGPPKGAPSGCLPWFAYPHRRGPLTTVYFGHWAALGYQRGDGYVALDSGCVWGRALTAVRLEDGAVFQEAALESSRSHHI